MGVPHEAIGTPRRERDPLVVLEVSLRKQDRADDTEPGYVRLGSQLDALPNLLLEAFKGCRTQRNLVRATRDASAVRPRRRDRRV